jgi:hypothetical protein
VAAQHYAAVYDRRPRSLWALSNEVLLRRCLDGRAGEVSRDEIATLEQLALRAMRSSAAEIERHDALFTRAVALLLGLRHLDFQAREGDVRQVRELVGEVIAEVGAYTLPAFSYRRVLRRIACWLPAADEDARRVAGELYEELEALGVARVWRER